MWPWKSSIVVGFHDWSIGCVPITEMAMHSERCSVVVVIRAGLRPGYLLRDKSSYQKHTLLRD